MNWAVGAIGWRERERESERERDGRREGEMGRMLLQNKGMICLQ